MALINENEASAFGYAVFGRAVFGLAFDGQNIPSELYDGFRAVCGLARPGGKVQKRYPWKVAQPGTDAQQAQWTKFQNGVDAFNALTPEEREWWYDEAESSGLFYFTYFMKVYLLGH